MSHLRIEYGVAAVALTGEMEIGDGRAVIPLPNGMLVAVTDGLGHGPQAALASRRAVEILHQQPDAPLVELVQHCHAALRGTRGAVMSLATFNVADGIMDWLGVGNVAGVFLRGSGPARQRPYLLTARAGVVGDSLPNLVPETLSLAAGDALILASDGISPGFAAGGLPSDLLSAQKLANQILLQSASGSDDALVLVARCLPATSNGGPPAR